MNNKDHLCLSNICIHCVEWYLWLGLLKALQASSEYLLSTTRNLQRNVEAITISMQVLPFSYWYVPFTHIMSRKCRKLQLRALVGRFGSQNAMVGRLDDLGAGNTLPISSPKIDLQIITTECVGITGHCVLFQTTKNMEDIYDETILNLFLPDAGSEWELWYRLFLLRCLAFPVLDKNVRHVSMVQTMSDF